MVSAGLEYICTVQQPQLVQVCVWILIHFQPKVCWNQVSEQSIFH